MAEWRAPDSCLVLSESDSKLYTNCEFCEENNHRHSKNILIHKSQAIYDDKNNSKKSLHIFRRRCKWCASSVQVDNVEQANV